MKEKGFTLIEILIALMVFAVLAVITSSVLYNVFETRKHLQGASDEMAKLQLAVFLLERDLTQAVGRKVNRGNFVVSPEIVAKNDYLELTTMGNINPLAEENRSTLQRVAYFARQGKLLRKLWTRVDTTKANAQEQVLLSDVKELKFAYLNENLTLLPKWEVATFASNPLPSAIQLNLTLEKQGEINLLFDLPESFKKKSLKQ